MVPSQTLNNAIPVDWPKYYLTLSEAFFDNSLVIELNIISLAKLLKTNSCVSSGITFSLPAGHEIERVPVYHY